MEYWISQVLVLVAYILLGLGLRKEKKVTLLYYSSIYQVLMMGQYVLLGGDLGAISSIMGLIRNIIFINNEKKHKKNSKCILVIFCIITIIFMAIFYNSLVDILPCMLTILGIYVYWCTDMKVIRLGNIGISICYILYAIPLNSWFSIICEGYLIVSTFIGYVKHENKAKLAD